MILERVLREAGVPDLVEVLAERLSPTDLQSLLLEVARRRAAAVTPARLLERYGSDRFVAPSPSDPLRLGQLQLDSLALLAERGWAPLELSPLAPLGSCSALGTVDQAKVVTTVRTNEVVSDVTNVLALEAAVRRRADRSAPVRLCAAQRVVRGQVFTEPGAMAHFRLLGLVAAGRSRTELFVDVVDAVLAVTGPMEVRVTPLDDRPWEPVVEEVALRHPESVVRMDHTRQRGRGYYVGACFEIGDCADGGLVPWATSLLSDRREQLAIGGIGLERLQAGR